MKKFVLALSVVLFALHAQADPAIPADPAAPAAPAIPADPAAPAAPAAPAGLQGQLTGKTLPSMYNDLAAHSFDFQLTAEGKMTGTLKVETTNASNECEGTFKESRALSLNHEILADLNCKAADGTVSVIQFELRSVSQAEEAKVAFRRGLVTMRYWIATPAANAAEAAQIEAMQNTFYTVLAKLK